MASHPVARELELVLQRFFALTPSDQLAAYRTIRDYLPERVRETRRDRVIAEKEAAVRELSLLPATVLRPRPRGEAGQGQATE